MEHKLKDIYARIKAGEIGPDAAAAALQDLKEIREEQSPQTGTQHDDARFQERALEYFHQFFATALKTSRQRLELDAALEEYGIDSVMVLQLTGDLEQQFGPLPKTLFYEYQTIRALSAYFLAEQQEKLTALLGPDPKVKAAQASEGNGEAGINAAPTAPVAVKPAASKAADAAPRAPKRRELVSTKGATTETAGSAQASAGIAVIGLSGRYPQARNMQEYWRNLREGRDCISEIPANRWDHSLYFDADKSKPGKTYAKWGGFIDGVDEFDPLFFGISPREAEIMEPQERLFLQCAYEAMEDAGYTRDTLTKAQGGAAANVGVFAGVMYEEYQLYGAQETARGRTMVLGGNPANIANRVSYFCNFHGPSMALDTMCSSSLTTIHLACQSIRRGECSVALAGGVNVSIHPNKYLLLGMGRFASSKGQCESFGEGGDGYVPGEGVGVVLLKPLQQAVADGDHIYGVIKGSAINHGGKTNGYTVPNPNAQAQVIAQALQEAAIPARAISYVEAHGTGTSLGDPIEIAGLSKAFSAHTRERQFCAIGSAKSNIGHCESAAGIAGLSKVLLQMQYGQIVPSLHSTTLNPNIDFSQTPFVVQQELQAWPRPVLEENGVQREYPRIAGLSSFGAGGSNAHLLIEEYIPPARTAHSGGTALILLSAKTETALHERAAQLAAALAENPALHLHDLAYTLQVGREAMEERLAWQVESLDELQQKLAAYLAAPAAEEAAGQAYRGQVKRNKEVLSVFAADEDMAQTINAWLNKGKFGKLLELWVKGLVFDWQQLYAGQAMQRISLPAYPFARERYWLPPMDGQAQAVQQTRLHPLLHSNTSDFREQRYSTLLSGGEYYLRDHLLQGQQVLPGAAQLEMARAALQLAFPAQEGTGLVALRDVAFVRPVLVTAELRLHIALQEESENSAWFEIYSEQDGEEIVHSQGRAVLQADDQAPQLDLAQWQQACQQSMSAEECYAQFQKLGLEYGPAMRALQVLRKGEDSQGQAFVLAQLALPEQAGTDAGHMQLNPSLLDASLQASIGLLAGEGKAALPFALEELRSFATLPAQAYALLRVNAGSSAQVRKLDIQICDAQGRVCAELLGFSSRVVETAAKADTLLFKPQWEVLPSGTNADANGQRWVLLATAQQMQAELEAALPGVQFLSLDGKAQNSADDYAQAAAQLLEFLRTVMRNPSQGVLHLQLVAAAGGEAALLQGLAGMLKSAALENSRLQVQLLVVESGQETQLAQLLQVQAVGQVRHLNGEYQQRQWQEIALAEHSSPWKDCGVYLITGGSGGLGLLFAEEIAAQTKQATLVLTARSALNPAQRSRLQALEASGARVDFRQVDVCDLTQVTELVQSIERDYAALNGIIHSAGVLRDGFLLKKSTEDLSQVLAPKVQGLLNLDLASRDCKLDCFLLFSSTSAAFGNLGQSDYAAANAYMDAYAAYRNLLTAGGQRHGRALSLNWPLWADGGMQVDEATRRQLWQSLGMRPMARADGVAALYRAWAADADQVLVVDGDVQRLRTGVRPPLPSAPVIQAPVVGVQTSAAPEDDLASRTEVYLTQLLARGLKLPAERIEAQVGLEAYGIDSVMVMELTRELEQVFGSLSKTLFFEYQSIRALAGYLLQSHRPRLQSLLGSTAIARIAANAATPVAASPSPSAMPGATGTRRLKRQAFAAQSAKAPAANGALDIAIIGLSGSYPQADTLQDYWQNLSQGKNCISEVPAARWTHAAYFDAEKGKPGKSYSKWGGFIDGVDQFDSLFFNITPREAAGMDPQERLFLQCVHATLEDAGYTREELRRSQDSELEGNVGVFVGVMYEEYQLYGAQAQALGDGYALPGTAASIANRVSYYFNLHGPSIALDTMCSSSLTAIHLACQSLARGGCELALAGGVNVSLHPNKYLLLSQGRFVSSDGLCRSFGTDGDGYVPGEGVGAVLLKPLHKAVADGDHIYGVIKASAINHGGKTNGYTVPNPQAQAQVIAQALKEAGIPARAISYIEAHGTGTSLGDPIEIAGLSKAFAAHTQDRQFCAIGSAKSNIGHCESAAGIAGLSKVLLQMQYGQLVPSLHSASLNPNIDFSQTPFVVQQELQAWPRPVLEENGRRREYPRTAGLSSFGAGGANAHLIVQEYQPVARAQVAAGPVVLVLSARDNQGLQVQVQQLLQALGTEALQSANLRDIAYTLQVGREAMECRLACVVDSMDMLRSRLQAFLAGEMAGLWHVDIRHSKDALALFAQDDEMQEAVAKWVQRGKLDKLAQLWSRGYAFDWRSLYQGQQQQLQPQRLSLPTYPFAKERHWLPEPHRPVLTGVSASVLHPLLHSNTSSLQQQRYSTRLTGGEYYLADHLVQGKRILPAAAQLEMARAALQDGMELSKQDGLLELREIAFVRPLVVEQASLCHIVLQTQEDGSVAFEIYSGQDGEEIVHSQGRAVLQADDQAPQLDLAQWQQACQQSMSAEECYAQFQKLGLEYGPAMRALQVLRKGEDSQGQVFVLAQLALPEQAGTDAEHMQLNPSLLDASLQASIGLLAGEGKAALPFALEELRCYAALPNQAYALLRVNAGSSAQVRKLDIQICDAQGQVCAQLLGFSSRVVETAAKADTLLFKPQWEVLPSGTDADANGQRWVLLATAQQMQAELEAALPGVQFLSLGGKAQNCADDYAQAAAQLLEFLRTVMRNPSQGVLHLQLVAAANGEAALLQGLAGMLKSAALENSRLQVQMLVVESGQEAQLAQLLQMRIAGQVRQLNGQYQQRQWQEIALAEHSSPWKDGGVYLITGGSGGLGLLFAEEIAAQTKQATLVLTARSALNPAQRSRLQALQASGARIEFKQVDVCDLQQVTELIAAIESECGPLNGIIHSAGVLRDGFLLKKSAQDLSQVLAPKVQGLVNLDLASRDCKLDCFLLFSSTSAAFGNLGQSDYAAANAFMDAYAAYRNLLSAKAQRHGRALSLNWPLWADGGMQVDEATRRQLWQGLGMRPMARADGVAALYRAWAAGADQVLVIDGDVQRLRRMFAAQQATVPAAIPSTPVVKAAVTGGSQLEEKALAYFRKLLAAAMKLPLQRLDVDARMDDYGIDSVMVMELTAELEKPFGALSKTLFFEYQSVRALTGYFLQAHRAQLESLLGTHSAATTQAVPAPQPAIQATNPRHSLRRMRAQAVQPAQMQAQVTDHVQASVQDIAVIGMSGRYAAAQNLAQMWRNLAEGKNCISEVPAERWDQNAYFDPQRGKAGKSYTKWAGFLDGVDEFDPLFFNISPREAEYMDPQERLFLQEAYAGIEDAGYTPATLSAGQKVAVFVGVMNGRYPSGAQYWSIANRVSYLLNFQGPSMAVDSACSSSLTALHLAMESLRNGSADCALAGGVNLIVDPQHLVVLSGATMLSAGDQCRSFGAHADGFVDGEGVGVVVLKPLQQAEADGDHIYGVLKGSMVNAGGRTNGYTVPNPNAQAQLVTDALARARINPRTVSYIEAHGTGTALGDPIEIAGLSKAFAVHTQDKQFCAIGSAKSNIGHCESAAGIAGLSKVLLQMQHGQIAPSLHSANLNPNIDFAQTPFVVQQTLAPWVRPVIQEAGQSREYPRIAGLSSFGAGGANAHVVVQEYVMSPRKEQFNGPALVVLSARTVDALQQRVSRLLQALQEDAAIDLHELAYTLQCGREAMEERLALLVTDHASLQQKLAAYLAGETEQDDVWRGQVKRNRDMMASFMADEDMLRALDAWLEKGKYDKLLEMWVKGLSFDWQRLYPAARPRRISLPSYPFAKDRYWLAPRQKQSSEQAQQTKISAQMLVLHPLLQRNASDLQGQRYVSEFSGKEYFLAGHVMQGRAMLPGAAQVEMARAALEHALGENQGLQYELRDIVFARPFVADGPCSLYIGVQRDSADSVVYEIYSKQGEQVVLHGQGRGQAVQHLPLGLDLPALQAGCQRRLAGADLYAQLEKLGMVYGPVMRALQEVSSGKDAQGRALAIGRLLLPQEAAEAAGAEQFQLHPSLLDGSLLAGIGLLEDATGEAKAALPFAIERVQTLRALPREVYAVVRQNPGSTAQVRKHDIVLCDAQGEVCAELSGFCSRLSGQSPPPSSAAEVSTVLLQATWSRSEAPAMSSAKVDRHLVLLCAMDEVNLPALRQALPGVECLNVSGEGTLAEVYERCAQQLLSLLKAQLPHKSDGCLLLQVVTPAFGPFQVLGGLAAMLKSAQLEHPALRGQLIELECADAVALAATLRENATCKASQVRYDDGQRYVAGWSHFTTQEVESPWRDRGVYLITGGSGGLGLIFAAEIARKAQQPTLILSARSALNEAQRRQLQQLAARGAKVEFRQLDVTQRDQVRALVTEIQSRFGALHGILHSAGVVRDGLMRGKTEADLAQVLAPKVSGLINLDEASRDCALDCFILFSSTSGALGNLGQTDYATANAFMDGYAAYRNTLVAGEQRRGRTLSVNWPLWADGGMQVDAAKLEMLWQGLGMRAMRSESGIHALYQAWASGQDQMLVIEGDRTRLLRLLQVNAVQEAREVQVQPKGEVRQAQVLQDWIAQAVSEILHLDLKHIEDDKAWPEFGFDSVTLFELANLLRQRHQLDLSPTLFFEHATIASLVRVLAQQAPALNASAALPELQSEPQPEPVEGRRRKQRKAASAVKAGMQCIVVAAEQPFEAALYYPAEVLPSPLEMGVFTLQVALNAPLPTRVQGLLLVSHGAAGSECSHHDLCCALAAQGYLVAALRHPGDNWRDASLLSSAAYLARRPKALSQLLDHLLADPHWSRALPPGKIGAIGHSAGAASVLALLGAQADPQRLLQHCETVDDDPVLCRLTMRAANAPAADKSLSPADFALADPRIRCAMLMAPMSVVFDPDSLTAIQVPLRIYTAQEDKVFNSKYNGARLHALLPQAEYQEVARAGHFAFMAQPNRAAASVIGDPAENPPGFDRAALQRRLAQEAREFFQRNLDAQAADQGLLTDSSNRH